MTRGETQLVTALWHGMPLRNFAEGQGLSVASAGVLLREALRKAECGTAAELIRLTDSLSALGAHLYPAVRADAPPACAGIERTPDDPGHSGGVILFVDDEPAACRQFARLAGPKLDVACARSVVEASKYLECNGNNVGVVVSDQRMPGKSGLDLLAAIKDHWPAARRVLTTAYADRNVLIASVKRAGIHRLILKPWDADQVRSIVVAEALMAGDPIAAGSTTGEIEAGEITAAEMTAVNVQDPT